MSKGVRGGAISVSDTFRNKNRRDTVMQDYRVEASEAGGKCQTLNSYKVAKVGLTLGVC